jgi:hypothetical protein
MTSFVASTWAAAILPVPILAATAIEYPVALPAAALHNPKDAFYRQAALDKTKIIEKSDVMKEKKHDPLVALDQTYKWSKSKKDLPTGGTTVIIDRQGNWSFAGLFDPYVPKLPPPQPLTGGFGQSVNYAVTTPPTHLSAQDAANWRHYNLEYAQIPLGREAALVFAFQSELGYVMTFAKGGFVSKTGLSWDKQGNDPIVKDLWSDVVKGHKWCAVYVFSPLMFQPGVAQPHAAQNEGNSALGSIASTLGTVGTIIASFF